MLYIYVNKISLASYYANLLQTYTSEEAHKI